MATFEEQIEEIEKEIKKTQYNKATEHHIGLLKAKIARLKDKQEVRASSGKKGEGYSIKKEGDATIIMLGFPSVGKSTLLNALTNAKSPVADYEFTTLDVIPGTMNLFGAQLQLLDVPGVVEGAASGRGKGKEVLAALRNADLCIFIVDITKPKHLKILEKEAYDAGIRLDQRLPDVKIKRKEKGGISVGSTVKLTKTTKEILKDVLKEFGYINADVVARQDITVEQYIDAIEANKAYMSSLKILTKADLVKEGKAETIKKKIGAHIIISVKENKNLEKLKEMMWNRIDLIRIYMKEPGKEPDYKEPLIIKKDATIKNVCDKLHRDFAKRFKFCRVSGSSAKFAGQKLALTHVLKDEDVLELHLL